MKKYEDIGLEQQIFLWEDWGDYGDGNLFFYDVELIVDVAPYKKGQKFNGAAFIIDNSTVEFFNDIDGEEPASMGKYFCRLVLEPYEKVVMEPVEE